MTTENAKMKESTELEKVYSYLGDQNSRLVSTISRLETMGHRLKNTDLPVPKSENKEQTEQPDGIIQSIIQQLGFYKAHNDRLEELEKKLIPLF